MKKLLILFLTIALSIIFISCNNANDYSILKEVKAEELEEKALSDFNITTDEKMHWQGFAANSILINDTQINDVEGMDIGLVYYDYIASPTGLYDDPYINLKKNSLLVFGDSYLNSNWIIVFYFEVSRNTNETWTNLDVYEFYIVSYVSRIDDNILDISKLFQGFNVSGLYNADYNSGNFYCLTYIDIYAEMSEPEKWAPVPFFNTHLNWIGSTNKKTYIIPQYLLYTEIDNNYYYNTEILTFISYFSDRPSLIGNDIYLDELYIKSYVKAQPLRYKVDNTDLFITGSISKWVFGSSSYSFMTALAPTFNVMEFNDTTAQYLEIKNTIDAVNYYSFYWGSPQTEIDEEIAEYFYYHVSQLVPAFIYEEEEPTPINEGGGSAFSKVLTFPLMIFVIPVLAVVAIFMSVNSGQNYFSVLGSLITNSFNNISNFFDELLANIFDIVERVVENIPPLIPEVPKTTAFAIGAGLVAVIIALIAFAVIKIIKNK